MTKEIAATEPQQQQQLDTKKDVQEQQYVENTVDSLLVTEDKLTATKTTTTTTTTTTITATAAMTASSSTADQTTSSRELPIFSNPLLADATQANSLPIKPKQTRIKAGSKMINMLKIHAPKVDGEVVIMRRTDMDLVHATAMFKAAYPAVSDRMVTQENKHVQAHHQGIVEKASAIAGVWVPVAEAKKLAREYDIEVFMRPLLEMAGERSTPEGAASQTDEAGSTTSSQEEGTVIVDQETVESVSSSDKSTEEEEEEEENEATPALTKVAGMKRRIEELEEESIRDKRKIRGLATVAVGLAAATAAAVLPAVLPSVLPYFSS